jgi:hypothetical protein
VIVILTDATPDGERLRRTAQAALRAAGKLGARAATIVGAEVPALDVELTPTARIRVPPPHGLGRLPGIAAATAIAIQLLAERLARARGLNPDRIGRDDPRQAAAAGE